MTVTGNAIRQSASAGMLGDDIGEELPDESSSSLEEESEEEEQQNGAAVGMLLS